MPSGAPPRTKHKWYRPSILALLLVAAVTVLGCVLAALSTSQPHASTDWYIVRATGFIAYGLFTVSVLVGLVVATRWHAFTGPWLVFERLHPLVLLAAGMVLAFHIATLILLSFPILQALVPFLSAFDPTPVALGILAMYLMIVLLLSTYMIGSIGYRTWHRLHYSGLAAWLLALLHGILVGNDSGQAWARAMYYGSAVLVVALLLVYCLGRLQAARRRSAPSASTGAVR